CADDSTWFTLRSVMATNAGSASVFCHVHRRSSAGTGTCRGSASIASGAVAQLATAPGSEATARSPNEAAALPVTARLISRDAASAGRPPGAEGRPQPDDRPKPPACIAVTGRTNHLLGSNFG